MRAKLRAAVGAAGAPPNTEADCVVVAPTDEAGLPIRAGRIGSFAPDLIGKLLAAGDRLTACVHGAGTVEVRVVTTLPAGRVVVDAETVLLVDLRCCATLSHSCRRGLPASLVGYK